MKIELKDLLEDAKSFLNMEKVTSNESAGLAIGIGAHDIGEEARYDAYRETDEKGTVTRRAGRKWEPYSGSFVLPKERLLFTVRRWKRILIPCTGAMETTLVHALAL